MPQISKAEFLKAYHEVIVGRLFVEDADYYRKSSERFWKCFDKIQSLGLPKGARAIDIGGGIMAVLMNRLLGFHSLVGDVVTRAQADVEALGLEFTLIDLYRDDPAPIAPVDLVVLQEVIEHIPQPPYIVIRRLEKLMKPDGLLFVTTPNGHRFRNLAYMIFNKEILAHYKYPAPGEALGHQHEYTLAQMRWQAEQAGMRLLHAGYYEDGFKGASLKARIAKIVTSPCRLVRHWQNGLMLVMTPQDS